MKSSITLAVISQHLLTSLCLFCACIVMYVCGMDGCNRVQIDPNISFNPMLTIPQVRPLSPLCTPIIVGQA